MSDEFPTRLIKKLPQGYTNKADGMDLPTAKEEMYKLQRNIASTQKDMKDDPKLEDAKIEVASLEEPYKDTIAGSKLMIRYLCYSLAERGL